MRRLSVLIAYDGTDYHGWQVQPGLVTIQSVLEEKLGEIEGGPVHVAGSGRTDAGVHALAACAAFDLENPIPAANLKRALNHILPGDIRILEVREHAGAFHPRFDAIAKTYEYRIWREEVCPPFVRRYFHHHPYLLDEAAMIEAAPLFEGEHDFSGFATADDTELPGKSKVRRIFSSRVSRDGEQLAFRVRGSGFLKHMVRLMSGFLIEIGKGNYCSADLIEQLRIGAAKPKQSVPACGLTQVSVEYPLP